MLAFTLSPENSHRSQTRTNRLCSSFPSSTNKTLIAAADTSKCSTVAWNKPTCTETVRTNWCSVQTFVATEPRKCTSSSATRARTIWSTKRFDAKTTFTHISTHWSWIPITRTRFSSTTKRSSLAIWKTIGTSWHQRKLRIQMQANHPIGMIRWAFFY